MNINFIILILQNLISKFIIQIIIKILEELLIIEKFIQITKNKNNEG